MKRKVVLVGFITMSFALVSAFVSVKGSESMETNSPTLNLVKVAETIPPTPVISKEAATIPPTPFIHDAK